MSKSEFDEYAAEYTRLHEENIKLSGETSEYFSEYKVKAAYEIAKNEGLSNQPRIVDFGSGIGNSIPFFHKYFPSAKLACVDVSAKSLELSKSVHGSSVDYMLYDGSVIPLEDESCDLIFAACVFHHIQHDAHEAVLGEFMRVLRCGGVVVIFEHNPYNPLTVRAVNTCPFDKDAVLIRAKTMKDRLVHSGFSNAAVDYRLFFPSIFKMFRKYERYLSWLPLGAQYSVSAVKRP